MVEIRYLGGVGSRAFEVAHGKPSHDAAFNVIIIGVAFDDVWLKAVDSAISEIVGALTPYASQRVLLNFLGDGDPESHPTRAAFSEEMYRQLQSLKTIYDPDNRFRFNHNIAPNIAETSV